jgi:hypothetical protein
MKKKQKKKTPEKLRSVSVSVPERDSYSVPSVCCCLAPAEDTFVASAAESSPGMWGLTKEISIEFPICLRCKEEFASSKEVPVSFLVFSVTGKLRFSFWNRKFAKRFAELNNGTLTD